MPNDSYTHGCIIMVSKQKGRKTKNDCMEYAKAIAEELESVYAGESEECEDLYDYVGCDCFPLYFNSFLF